MLGQAADGEAATEPSAVEQRRSRAGQHSLVFFATPVRFEGDGENKDNRVSPYITIEIPELSDYRVADDTS
ncbi:unnamed protein product [Fusarium graminearum]|uniref:Uncharacterized protein n=1 Tax=Gibberella zeae TaxID=5518 RepID=A0A9N8NFP5_GIBZA|nr:unnamed protein product [Fusarium graminearum]